jgi:uncharacterized protein
MKVIISEIPEEGIEIELNEKLPTGAFKILSPVKGFLKIDKIGTELSVKGIENADIEQQCSRCLNTFITNIKVQINVVYHPVVNIGKEEHHELKGDELNTGFYKGDVLDTDDLLAEQMLLNIPMKPLCSTDCKGICPKCGADLNIKQCNCVVSEIDSRLAVLKQLLGKKDN